MPQDETILINPAVESTRAASELLGRMHCDLVMTLSFREGVDGVFVGLAVGEKFHEGPWRAKVVEMLETALEEIKFGRSEQKIDIQEN